jgi:hypothetical protein
MTKNYNTTQHDTQVAAHNEAVTGVTVQTLVLPQSCNIVTGRGLPQFVSSYY